MCVTPRHIVGRRYDTGREKGCSLIEDLGPPHLGRGPLLYPFSFLLLLLNTYYTEGGFYRYGVTPGRGAIGVGGGGPSSILYSTVQYCRVPSLLPYCTVLYCKH